MSKSKWAGGWDGLGGRREGWGGSRGARFRGHYCSFFRQRNHFPFPPFSSWWMLMEAGRVIWRYRPWHHPNGHCYKATVTSTQPPWPSLCCFNGGRGSAMLQPSSERPPPICLLPLHAWLFYRLCPNSGGWRNPWRLLFDPGMVSISKVQCWWNGCLTLIQ